MGLHRPPAHPSPQLVELAQAEPLGVFDHHDHRIWHIHPHLDDGGGHQELDLPGLEGPHGLFFVSGLHLPVEKPYPVSGKGPVSQFLCVFGSRLQAQVHLPGLDEGADDIRLVSLVQMGADKAEGPAGVFHCRFYRS